MLPKMFNFEDHRPSRKLSNGGIHLLNASNRITNVMQKHKEVPKLFNKKKNVSFENEEIECELSSFEDSDSSDFSLEKKNEEDFTKQVTLTEAQNIILSLAEQIKDHTPKTKVELQLCSS